MRLTTPPWRDNTALHVLFSLFPDEHASLRIVGGAVRDALMQRPIGDIDCATTLLPEVVMQRVEAAGHKAIPTGLAHGTVTVVIEGVPFEITTLRTDVACDGRHAEIAFTDDWAQDAERRDFTCNAVYADLDGTLHDYVEGSADAKAGCIRFIGDASSRIQEDGLRILRYFRFQATHGKTEMEPSALEACAAHHAMLHDLSGERIAQEMRKLLAAKQVSDVVKVMSEHHILAAIALPRHSNMNAIKWLDDHAPAEWLLRLGLLCHCAEDPVVAAQNVSERWKLSRAEHKHLLGCVMPIPLSPEMQEAEQKRLIRRAGKSSVIAQSYIQAALHPDDADACLSIIDLAQKWEIPRFPVTGAMLIDRGVPSGPDLGKLLTQLEDKWEASGYKMSVESLLLETGTLKALD